MGLLGNYKDFTLDNGLRVITQRIPNGTVYATLNVNFGAYSERQGEEGLVHLLEHALFMGGNEKYSHKECNSVKEGFNYLGARTGLDKMLFPSEMVPSDVEIYLDFISNIIFHPTFERLDQEKERVLIETTESYEHPYFAEYTRTVLNGARRDCLGKEETVVNATADQLREIHKRGFYPNNMQLIMIGEVPDNLDSLTEKYFGKEKPGNVKKIIIPEIKSPERTVLRRPGGIYNIEDEKESLSRILMAFRAPKKPELKCYPAMVLTRILENDLFYVLSDQTQLCYNVTARYDSRIEFGSIILESKVNYVKQENFLEILGHVLKHYKYGKIKTEDIEKAKRVLNTRLFATLQSNDGRLENFQYLIENRLTPEERLGHLSSVSLSDVKESAKEIIPDVEKDDSFVLFIGDPSYYIKDKSDPHQLKLF